MVATRPVLATSSFLTGLRQRERSKGLAHVPAVYTMYRGFFAQSLTVASIGAAFRFLCEQTSVATVVRLTGCAAADVKQDIAKPHNFQPSCMTGV